MRSTACAMARCAALMQTQTATPPATAAAGPHMTNTDSGRFQDLVAAVSLRENERGAQVGAGWNPNWHQATDLFSTYSDNFRLGLNAAQTTVGAVAQLTGATIR